MGNIKDTKSYFEKFVDPKKLDSRRIDYMSYNSNRFDFSIQIGEQKLDFHFDEQMSSKYQFKDFLLEVYKGENSKLDFSYENSDYTFIFHNESFLIIICNENKLQNIYEFHNEINRKSFAAEMYKSFRAMIYSEKNQPACYGKVDPHKILIQTYRSKRAVERFLCNTPLDELNEKISDLFYYYYGDFYNSWDDVFDEAFMALPNHKKMWFFDSPDFMKGLFFVDYEDTLDMMKYETIEEAIQNEDEIED